MSLRLLQRLAGFLLLSLVAAVVFLQVQPYLAGSIIDASSDAPAPVVALAADPAPLPAPLANGMPACGDGAVDAPETCDAGNACGTDVASCNRTPGTRGAACACDPADPACRTAGIEWASGCQWPRCGDGAVNNLATLPDKTANFDLLHEDCDDGNVRDGDGCNSICRAESAQPCGNRVLDAGEQCDDGNRSAGDGCSPLCRLEENVVLRCGDGIVTSGEDCDDGSACADDPASCNQVPGTRGARCACDPADPRCALPAEASFSRGCTWARCGDGVVNNILVWNGARLNFDLLHEECDDGNVLSGDGCSAVCRREANAGAPRAAAPVSSSSRSSVAASSSLRPAAMSSSSASLRDVAVSHPPAGETGPGVLVLMVAGAAAGYALVRKGNNT